MFSGRSQRSKQGCETINCQLIGEEDQTIKLQLFIINQTI